MRKCKGCSETEHFRLLEVCSTAEVYKNDPLSKKLYKRAVHDVPPPSVIKMAGGESIIFVR